ncbi:uncharacterized protein TERG_12693 [Trichophyton rubrum CBS 118892]|uniref:Uncharacterized protein n=1 Tax=Trichophyton rubrum (strain ATCC MYA-4607 / CBS 118892) TaxID=559305 RepID=A0A080WMN0_TRIRC|nr:uncharacterized protein TERG_12693 [Trichophyton rubrum CBS 118892]KFL63069.1 hypothetical protein TERG_12693 [Trichophyton rubrum CBS 118892]
MCRCFLLVSRDGVWILLTGWHALDFQDLDGGALHYLSDLLLHQCGYLDILCTYLIDATCSCILTYSLRTCFFRFSQDKAWLHCLHASTYLFSLIWCQTDIRYVRRNKLCI